MISRVLIKFNKKPCKNQDFKEHKLLTIRFLILTKDQLTNILIYNMLKEEIQFIENR